MIRKSMPSGYDPMGGLFPRDKREAFARRSCSNKNTERDDDSKKRHPALGRRPLLVLTVLDEIVDNSGVRQCRGVAEAGRFVLGDLAQDAPHDLA